MASRQFDIQLIPKFSGVVTDMPIMEWLKDLEVTCELCEITKVDRVLPVRLKGVNVALMWEATILHLHTDSVCVHKWITDTLTGEG